MSLSLGNDAFVIAGVDSALGAALEKRLPERLPRVLTTKPRSGIVADLSDVGSTLRRQLDLRTADQAWALAEDMRSRELRPRWVVVCAANTSFLGAATDMALYSDAALSQLHTNLLGPALLCSVFYHVFWKHSGSGGLQSSVVLVSSQSARHVFDGSGQATYASSKAGLEMLARHLAHDLHRHQVAVNCLAPDSFPGRVTTDQVLGAVATLLGGRVSGRIVDVK